MLERGLDDTHYSLARIQNLGIEVHRGHELGDGTPNQIDQDKDSILLVLDSVRINDEEDKDIEEDRKQDAHHPTDHSDNQKLLIDF